MREEQDLPRAANNIERLQHGGVHWRGDDRGVETAPAAESFQLGREVTQLRADRSEFGALSDAAPESDRDMRNYKILPQAPIHRGERPIQFHDGQQARAQAVHFGADRVVLLAEMDQLGELLLQRAILVA